MCCFLSSLFKIQLCNYLIKKKHFYPMRKNSDYRILKEERKGQYLSTVPKSFSLNKN